MAQRLTSAELPRRTASRQTRKDCAKQQFYAVFVFCCKKRGITQPPVVFNCNPWMLCNRGLCSIATDRCIATAGCVPIATRGCMATVGLFSIATHGCIATAGCVSIATRGCVATAGCIPVATHGCIATVGWVPITTRGCIATVGWVLVATRRCIATAGCVRHIRQRKEGMVKPSLLIFNQRFRASECGYVCEVAPRTPAPGRAPQGG